MSSSNTESIAAFLISKYQTKYQIFSKIPTRQLETLKNLDSRKEKVMIEALPSVEVEMMDDRYGFYQVAWKKIPLSADDSKEIIKICEYNSVDELVQCYSLEDDLHDRRALVFVLSGIILLFSSE